ncbi:PASTA domain-containing protein [Actinoplanes sp. NPDC049118]|uniref:PASTA domain-containing protein n=1 Tax=Actinoplanes sp. NPDC049118 TaxID=3155769 RepID=UPI00340F2D3C
MSDDEEPRRPDETSEFSASADEGGSRPNDGPRKGDGAADPTEEMPRTTPDDDATVESPRTPPADATSELPAAEDPGTRTERYDWVDDGGPAWSGRAGVRPRPGYADDADWSTMPPGEPNGKWWMPIVVGIVALLLLALLGWGIYLIVQSTGEDAGTPPAVTASAAPPPTVEPTTAAPSTAPATTEPTRSVAPSPTDITVPALKGLSSDEARAALDRKRLSYRLRFVTSDSPAGTVIDSDPAEGQQVPADTVITLIIAAAPTTAATPTPADTTTGPAGQQDED